MMWTQSFAEALILLLATAFLASAYTCKGHSSGNCKTEGECSGLGLTAIPCGISYKITQLDLSDNEFTTITSDMFESFNHVNSLDLGQNSITTLGSQSFSTLAGLTTLYLTGNDITSIASDAISDSVMVYCGTISDYGTCEPDGCSSQCGSGVTCTCSGGWGPFTTFTCPGHDDLNIALIVTGVAAAVCLVTFLIAVCGVIRCVRLRRQRAREYALLPNAAGDSRDDSDSSGPPRYDDPLIHYSSIIPPSYTEVGATETASAQNAAQPTVSDSEDDDEDDEECILAQDQLELPPSYKSNILHTQTAEPAEPAELAATSAARSSPPPVNATSALHSSDEAMFPLVQQDSFEQPREPLEQQDSIDLGDLIQELRSTSPHAFLRQDIVNLAFLDTTAPTLAQIEEQTLVAQPLLLDVPAPTEELSQ
eukprot:m.84733 g.84733  ORF g.84733 m.84733 type:complete len:423 (-) comp50848_c0_seq4:1057-2325(-)